MITSHVHSSEGFTVFVAFWTLFGVVRRNFHEVIGEQRRARQSAMMAKRRARQSAMMATAKQVTNKDERGVPRTTVANTMAMSFFQ